MGHTRQQRQEKVWARIDANPPKEDREMKDATWKCTCGERHTGHVDVIDPLFRDADSGHQPVSVWEYRLAVAGRNYKGELVA